MPTTVPAVERIERAVAATLAPGERYVLAVSGGRDSMVLLDAAARAPSAAGDLLVAVFDHGTGAVATRAAEFVASEAASRALPCVIGRAGGVLRGEAAWREARWGFLGGVAERESAAVATAHTLNDQVETVVIRILRDAGARGLAGLYAPSAILRPLVSVTRADVSQYAATRDVRFVSDPTNVSRRHLRNRVRLDLLPAIARARPGFELEVLDMASEAALWRQMVARAVDALEPVFLDRSTIRIAVGSLRGYDPASLRVVWPEVAARVGVTMDRRGTERAAAFTIDTIAALSETAESRRPGAGAASSARPGGPRGRGGRGRVIQLSGGAEIEQVGGAFVLRRQ